MHTHLASSLRGPVFPRRACWTGAEPVDAVPALDDPQIRTELVQRVRKEIAAGTYDTPEKFEAALEKMLEELDE